MVLLLVLVVVVALSFSAAFTVIMRTGQGSCQMTGRRIQSRYLVDSGVDTIRLYLSQTDTLIGEESGGTYDNPTQFQALTVYSNPEGAESGRVSVVSPALDDRGSLAGFRFGLVLESSKLNLNILPQIDTLMLDQEANPADGIASDDGGSRGRHYGLD